MNSPQIKNYISPESAGTDLTALELKIKLRRDHLPGKEVINVLDVFHGTGKIWNFITDVELKEKGRKIKVLGIDKRSITGVIQLKGDNVKYLMKMDLSKFDVLDADAYGSPVKILSTVFKNGSFKGVVFFTHIQTLFGALPKEMLEGLGYTQKMTNKIPSLFNSNGFEKFKNWLSVFGIDSVSYYKLEGTMKFYGVFKIKK